MNRLEMHPTDGRRADGTPRGGGSPGRGPRGGRPGPGGGRGRGRGFGRPGGWQQGDLPPADDAQAWFAGRLPDGWFDEVEVTVDREEIVVVGALAGVAPDTEAAAAEGRLARFRADTREQRMAVAEEAQARYGRTVSWGARAGGTTALFTHLAVPVMTRLRQPERAVLDTLVDAGVARSRSDALAWCVRLVGEHTESWLGELREAMAEVDKLRASGPDL
ncbi:hypothetical protein [uncultured Phycicoccus sp.]|uniref:hypothetical protein n=1 Tax=uncultured Phycicoccus sp. TaxID=661422 RepID=UPI00262486D1|nr:hypothetical protein [uncultured Phycicoccus sp.]